MLFWNCQGNKTRKIRYLGEKAVKILSQDPLRGHVDLSMLWCPWNIKLMVRKVKREKAITFLWELQHGVSTPVSSSSICLQLSTMAGDPTSPPPQPPATSDLFTVSMVLPFPESYKVGIIQYVVFSERLLSLSNMHLKVLYVLSCLDSSLLFSIK